MSALPQPKPSLWIIQLDTGKQLIYTKESSFLRTYNQLRKVGEVHYKSFVSLNDTHKYGAELVRKVLK